MWNSQGTHQGNGYQIFNPQILKISDLADKKWNQDSNNLVYIKKLDAKNILAS